MHLITYKQRTKADNGRGLNAPRLEQVKGLRGSMTDVLAVITLSVAQERGAECYVCFLGRRTITGDVLVRRHVGGMGFASGNTITAYLHLFTRQCLFCKQ